MENQTNQRGGKRLGAGRPANHRTLEARGIVPLSAKEVLMLHGERKLWHRILNSDDDNVVLRALVYLTDRRDGKAAQVINVTSTTLNISSDDLIAARAIARNVIAATNARVNTNASDNVSCADVPLMIEGDCSQLGSDSDDSGEVGISEGDISAEDSGEVVNGPNASGEAGGGKG